MNLWQLLAIVFVFLAIFVQDVVAKSKKPAKAAKKPAKKV